MVTGPFDVAELVDGPALPCERLRRTREHLARHSSLLRCALLALLPAAGLSGQISLPAGSFITSVTPGAALGVFGNLGDLAFVPAGLPNAGDLLVSSYNNGDLFTIGLDPGPGGMMMPTTATLFAALAAGTEGLRFIPSGSQSGDLAVVNWNRR